MLGALQLGTYQLGSGAATVTPPVVEFDAESVSRRIVPERLTVRLIDPRRTIQELLP